MRTTLITFLAMAVLGTQAHAAIIAVPVNIAPWALTPDLPAGQRGIYADLADAVAARAKTRITVTFVPYGRMLEGVRSGEFDYAFSIVSQGKAAAAPFTVIIAKAPMIAVARKGLSLKTLADMHHFAEVGQLRGGSCGAEIDDDPAIHRVSQDSYELGIRKLAAGRLDGWCSIKAGFIYTLDKTDMAAKIGDQLDYGEVQVGMQVTRAKLDTAETKDVRAVIEGLLADGTVGRIFSRYVGKPYTP
ncbi:ABC transporter substrate-binding protein [Beijerinckia sp. L45]|uniref:substrate-binding periplasmic protein n=1 Tax=Beijerinckia sp. L45 TaxID=1641855 RepID=UPI00131E5A98|nr:transporter substrate-binding domain-containing protein [Beijerinckia sp. L45]